MFVPGLKSSAVETKLPIKIIILGSTGSIGGYALEVVRENPGVFEVVGLVAGRNSEKLAQQTAEFRPKYSIVNDTTGQATLELCQTAEYDIALAAVVGIAGLKSVLACLQRGKNVALANKESLVAAGRLVKSVCKKSAAKILPVDSEHSALFQVLQGEPLENVRKLILTASGGPFFRTPLDQLHSITPEQAVKHPNWSMGRKISVDSATMMNKALEVIEAHWLYDMPPDMIDVLIHPQSIIHSLIELKDRTQLAQLGRPDMKAPIAYALTYPGKRLGNVSQPLDLSQVGQLEFLGLNDQRFPSIKLAKQTIVAGGAMSAIFNIANEIAVDAFLRSRLGFLQIFEFVQNVVESMEGRDYSTLEDLNDLEAEVRAKFVA